ncbi:MAG TPA: hypothetical protein VM184_10820 [Gaiellaceae bacterium]|nr:hypothetical protein [Gaiellaceae bacterium]
MAMFASAPKQSFLIVVFLDAMLRVTGVSSSAVAALHAAARVVSAAAVLVLGAAADRLQLRAIWTAIAVGLAVACASRVSRRADARLALSCFLERTLKPRRHDYVSPPRRRGTRLVDDARAQDLLVLERGDRGVAVTSAGCRR